MGITQSNNTDILKIFANDQRMILYRPEWRTFAGSVTATILLQQILYRWDKNGRKPFYKFKESCSHDLYREGDSWTEELGFSRKEFDSALKKIGTKINRATKGTPLTTIVEYWTDLNRITFYTINPEILQTELEKLYSSTPEPGFTKSPKGDLQVKPQSDFTKTTIRDLEYKQRLPTKINNVRRETVKSEPSITPQPTEKEPLPLPLSSLELIAGISALMALVPEPYQTNSIKSLIKRHLHTHSEVYVRQTIQYTTANSTGQTEGKYRAFLGKALENGWGEGYEPDDTGQIKETKIRDVFKAMPIQDLKILATTGNKYAQEEMEKRC